MKSVSLETFNLSRFAIFVDYYLKTGGDVLPVKTCNTRENVWFFIKDEFDVCSDRIAIGISLQSHRLSNAKQLNQLIDLYATDDDDCQYILTFETKNKINISLKKNFIPSALLESVFQAIVLYFAQNSSQTKDPKLKQIINELNGESKDTKRLLELSRKYAIDSMSRLTAKAGAEGWDTSKVLITPSEWRFESS